MVTTNDFLHFYENKKIFLTGHTGFKGSWMLCWLNLLGAQVKGYALEPEQNNSIFNLIHGNALCQSIIADIRDKKKLHHEIENFNPDIIFHFAAQPLVRRSYQIPSETFEVNVIGTSNILESVIPLNKKCTVVCITTDKVYENKELDYHYKENDRLGGYDPYSASKAATETAINSFRNSFFNRKNYDSHQKAIVSARAGNVIGGGDWSDDRIMPDIVRALQNKKEIEIRNPHAIRPWQHVLEPLNGYLLLAMLAYENYDAISNAYNFGPQPKDHLPVKNVVETSIQHWGSGNWKDISNMKQPHEAGLLMLDINKAQQELHWHPKLDFNSAVEWTINWYKSNDDKFEFTQKQINRYQQL